MHSAKGRKEVVQRRLVGDIDRREAQAPACEWIKAAVEAASRQWLECRPGERLGLQLDFEEKTRGREERGLRGRAKLLPVQLLGWYALHASRHLRAPRLTAQQLWQGLARAATGKCGKPFPARPYAGAENCRPRQSRTPQGRAAPLHNARATVRTMKPSFPCVKSGYIHFGLIGNGKSEHGCLCATPEWRRS